MSMQGNEPTRDDRAADEYDDLGAEARPSTDPEGPSRPLPDDSRSGHDDALVTDDDRVDEAAGEQSPADADAGVAADAGLASAGSSGPETLLGEHGELSRRWNEVQATFVDNPQQAVTEAGALVEDVLARLSDTFSAERGRSEAAEHDGDQTEHLRVAMQRYREFFRRLLAA